MNNYGYVVVKVRDEEGSKLYQMKDSRERQAVPNSLGLLAASNVQVVTLSDPETYGEYKPYSVVDTIQELYAYVLALDPQQ